MQPGKAGDKFDFIRCDDSGFGFENYFNIIAAIKPKVRNVTRYENMNTEILSLARHYFSNCLVKYPLNPSSDYLMISNTGEIKVSQLPGLSSSVANIFNTLTARR